MRQIKSMRDIENSIAPDAQTRETMNPQTAETGAPFSARLSADDELHWLALKMAAGLGTRKAGLLIEIFRTPQAILDRSSKLPGSPLRLPRVSPAAARSKRLSSSSKRSRRRVSL
jgi:hypothetical protein